MNLENLILYRDALILVLNKPSGIPVHKGSGKLTALDAYFDQIRFGLPRKPELTHRLDKDTSGCLVLGRHAQALRRMGKLFEKNLVQKTYHAIVHGLVQNDEGLINLPIAPQSDKSYHWWGKVDHENGKEALTDYKVLKRFDNLTYVELRPKTGRTHQLRIHMQALGHPIVGDQIYGDNDQFEKLCLHAEGLTIPLYPKKEPIIVHAPLPDHMMTIIK